MTTTTPNGKDVTAKFNRMDTSDMKRIVDTADDGTLSIRTDGAWYQLGLILTVRRKIVTANGGTRITTPMLKADGVDSIAKERRRDGEQLYLLEAELNEFINSANAPKLITNVTKLLADYAASLKTSADDDDSADMTAAELAASTLKIAKAKNIDVIALMQELANQASGSGNGVDIVEFNATEISDAA